MSELQHYYQEYACGRGWMADDASECGCRGRGWFISEVDTVHKCPRHFAGQPHPEDHEEDMVVVHVLERKYTSEYVSFSVWSDEVQVVYGLVIDGVDHPDPDSSRWCSKPEARKIYARLRKIGYTKV